MADRAGTSVVLLFVRLEATRRPVRPAAADELAVDAAEVLLSAIRDADLPARIAPDTFCVLLSGDAKGAEVSVLSRLVEAIAVHDAKPADPRRSPSRSAAPSTTRASGRASRACWRPPKPACDRTHPSSR